MILNLNKNKINYFLKKPSNFYIAFKIYFLEIKMKNKIMKKIIGIIVLCCFVHMAISQTGNNTETLLNIEGQIALTTNGKAIWYNMGGPSLKFSFKKLVFSISMFPSLKFEKDATHPVVMPILGIGPQIYFFKNKRFILTFPYYYIASRNIWELTGGIGYVLTSAKE